MKININQLDFSKQNGLLPVVVQDHITRHVLMLGFMNEAALQKTIQEKFVTFYSRNKNRLWQKGETSGHKLECIDIFSDCDNDSLLILAKPYGPTCHLGTTSCFCSDEITDESDLNFLTQLYELLAQRKKELPDHSYTASLFKAGDLAINEKIIEEAAEVTHAVTHETKQRLIEESCDLLFHLMILLVEKEVRWKDIIDELKKRTNPIKKEKK